jgi:DNA-binding beta-propeller fold protein YncE
MRRVAPLAAAVVTAGSLVTATVAAGTAALADSPGRSSVPDAPIRTHQIHVGGHPGQAAVDPRTGTAWIGTGTEIVRIRESTGRVVGHVPFHSVRIAVDPIRGLLWAVDDATGNLAEIRERTGKVIRTPITDRALGQVAVDPRTGTVWVVANLSVVELSEATGRVLHTIKLLTNGQFKAPFGVAVDPVRGTVWVSILPDNRNPVSGWIDRISESSHRVTHMFLSGIEQAAMAVDPVRGTVWVASGGVSLHVIRESTGRVKTITGVQNNATGVAIDPAARKVLVADDQGTGSSVFILSEKTDQITSKIGVRFFPSNPAIDPVTGKAYVPIAFRATVTEFRI